MAFSMPASPSKSKPASRPAAEPPQPPVSGDGVEYSSAALRQDSKARDRLKQQDPGSLDQHEQLARTHALRTLNGLRMIAPALREALTAATSQEAQVAHLVELVKSAHAFAVQGCQYLDLDPTLEKNRWAVAMLERVFTTTFADQPPSLPVAEAVYKLALEAAAERGEERVVPPTLEESTLVRQALVRGMGPLLREQSAFAFFRPDPAADIEWAAQLLVDACEQVMAEHVLPLTADSERQTMLASLIEEGGRLLAQAWHVEAELAQQSVRSRSKEQMARFLQANPAGLPLDRVAQNFRQQMARLSRLMKVPRPRR